MIYKCHGGPELKVFTCAGKPPPVIILPNRKMKWHEADVISKPETLRYRLRGLVYVLE